MSEDCAYCPQSVRFDTGLETQELLEVDEWPRVPRRQGIRSHALLHGRGLPLAQAEGSSQGAGDDPRGEVVGNGDLRHLGMVTPEQRGS